MSEQESTTHQDAERNVVRNTCVKAYSYDPLARLLLDGLRLTTGGAALLVIVLMLAIDIVGFILVDRQLGTLALSHYETDSGFLGPAVVGPRMIKLFDWDYFAPYLVYCYVVTPLVAAAYVWVSRSSGTLVYDLRHSQALSTSSVEFDRCFRGEDLGRVVRHGAALMFTLLAIAATGLAARSALQDVPDLAPQQWLDVPQIRVWRTAKILIVYVPLWYMVCQIVSRELCAVGTLWRLFRRIDYAPQPLHPDGCGGLRPINDYAVGFTYVIGLFGLATAIQMVDAMQTHGIGVPVTMIWMSAGYVLFGLLFFFLPPWVTHFAMLRARRRESEDIAAQIRAAYVDLRNQGLESGEESERLIAQIHRLRTLHELVEKAPVWPIENKTLKRILGFVSFPPLSLLLTAAARSLPTLLRFLQGDFS